jgi:membrane protein insertase, YidC/Oxa1 family, C-terminal domain
MLNAVLTKSTMPVIGWISSILGYVINGIYWGLEQVGIPNIGLAIILFTVVMNLIMTPLQIKQQKFSRLNNIMMPEIKAVQEKFKGKKDQNSQMAMQQETTAIYNKYGVSPTGSCLQLAIQMPVILALYQVINHIPGYISSIANIFSDLVEKIAGVIGYTGIIEGFLEDNKLRTIRLIIEDNILVENSIIDFLYRLNPDQWAELTKIPQFSGFSDIISNTAAKMADINNFLGMNISDNPMAVVQKGWADKAFLLVLAAALIPILAWLTQWLNTKLMPQPAANGNGESNTMENSMKSVNVIMPVFSAIMCVTLPIGIGIYWIAGAAVRIVQQLIINKHLEKTDINEMIKANQEKAKKKREKKGLPVQKIAQQAQTSARNINNNDTAETKSEKEAAIKKATEYYNSGNVKQGSIAAKANMVKKLDDKNKK